MIAISNNFLKRQFSSYHPVIVKFPLLSTIAVLLKIAIYICMIQIALCEKLFHNSLRVDA